MSILNNKSKRYVIKVGTSTLTHSNGKLNLGHIEKLVRIITDIRNMGHEVVLVSSGAIGVAVGKLGMSEKPESVRLQQALAAIGQVSLISIYDRLFKEYGYNIAQVLLTKFILDEETRYNCAKRAFNKMFDLGVIPIVNENDVISTYEIEFGDNDTLSAYIAELVDADMLILLSDIDGFYDCDPRSNKDANVIPIVEEITDELRACAGGEGTRRGTGGMKTKLKAAKFVNDNGIDMVLTNGSKPENIYKILNGESVGTLFKHKEA